MTDVEYRLIVRRIKSVIKKWQWMVAGWSVSWVFVRDRLEEDAAASVEVEWKYCEAQVAFGLFEMMEQSDSEIERVVVHEMMHILVSEMRGLENMDHEERVVTVLTRVVTNGKGA
jgi:hypothetical protein